MKYKQALRETAEAYGVSEDEVLAAVRLCSKEAKAELERLKLIFAADKRLTTVEQVEAAIGIFLRATAKLTTGKRLTPLEAESLKVHQQFEKIINQ